MKFIWGVFFESMAERPGQTVNDIPTTVEAQTSKEALQWLVDRHNAGRNKKAHIVEIDEHADDPPRVTARAKVQITKGIFCFAIAEKIT